MAGLASAMMDAFQSGYDLPGKLRAKAAAVDQFGASAEDPGLFSALGQEQRAQNADVRADNQDNRAERGTQVNERADVRRQETHDASQGDDETKRRTGAVLGVVQGLRTARDRGDDIGEAFDAQIDILKQLGVDENDIPEMRQSVVDNPAVLDDYLATIQGTSGSTATGRLTDKQRALQIKNNPNASEADTQWADTIINGKDAEGRKAAVGGALERATTDIFNRLDILEDPDMEAAGRAIFGIASPGKIMRGGGGNTFDPIAGTPAADYLANFNALEGDIRSAAFETLKGGGQITEKESEFAANAISRLTRTTSFEEYKRELKRLRAYLNRLKDVAQRRMDGEDVPDITLTTEDSPETQSIHPGWTDEDGNTFKGGDPSDSDNWELAE